MFSLETTEDNQKTDRSRKLQLLTVIIIGYTLFLMIITIQYSKFGHVEQLTEKLQQAQYEFALLQQDTNRLCSFHHELSKDLLRRDTLAFLSFQQQSLIAPNQQVILDREAR